MSHKKFQKPTDAELEILQVLWAHGPSSVRFVNDQLTAIRKIGYTTTLKVMQIMVGKDLVNRNTDARTHIYEANVSEAETQSKLLENFLDTAFRGSATQLVMQALGNHQTSPQELAAIKNLIEKIENQE